MSRSVAALLVLFVASIAIPTTSVAFAAPVPDPTTATSTHEVLESGSAACALDTATAADDSNGNVSVTTWVAPAGSYDELQNASAIAAIAGTRSLTRVGSGEVANGDVVVHRLRLNGSATQLLDGLAAQNRGSPTANFQALVQREGVEFRYVGASACPPELALNATIERDALRVVPDRENDALYLLVDVDDAMFDPPGDTGPTADGWELGRHAMSLELRRSSGLVAENVTVKADYDVAERRASFVAPTEGLVQLSPASNQTIRGHTTVAPGTEIRVLLRPVEASTGPLGATATVNRSRGFEARFDLSGISGDALYAVRVAGMERDEDFRSVTIAAVGNATGAVVFAGTPESEGLVLDDLSVATTDGGFAVIRNASGGIVGHSRYLDPGAASVQPDLRPPIRTNQTVTVTLYRDVNGNQTFDPTDEPYRVNGSAVRDTANVTIEGEPPDVPTTRTTTTIEMPPKRTATSTTRTTLTTATVTKQFRSFTGDNATKTTTTPVPIPGFGAVVAALAGLLAIALVRRRDE